VTYAQQIRDYLKPTIGSIPLAQLSVEDVEHAYREILTTIRPGLEGSRATDAQLPRRPRRWCRVRWIRRSVTTL